MKLVGKMLEVFDSKNQTRLTTPRISVESVEVPRLYLSDSDSHYGANLECKGLFSLTSVCTVCGERKSLRSPVVCGGRCGAPQYLDGVTLWRCTRPIVGETAFNRTEVPRRGATQMQVQ